MKKFLRKILPASIWQFLRKVKDALIRFIIDIKILLHLPLKKKRQLLGFRIRVAEHCNLNCKGCNNFAPIAEPEFVDLNELHRDLTRLGELFEHKCNYIYLTGGEALLNPNLTTIMKMARNAFSYGTISVFSNGILLSQQPDSFWNACRENNIEIICTAYPININVEEVRTRAESFGVKFQWAWGQKEHEINTFVIEPINLAGNSDIKRNFASCIRANNCVYLIHGRMYTCSFVATIRHFNKYFNKNIPITEEDSINIYDDITGDEILSRLAKPIPICRFCNLKRKVIEWGISEKKISEWV